MQGTIKRYFTDKGYGFITPEEGGGDVFVHATAARDKSVLVDGAKVIFEVTQERKGPQAQNVRAA